MAQDRVKWQAGSPEINNEHSRYVKEEDYSELLSKYWLLRKDSAT